MGNRGEATVINKTSFLPTDSLRQTPRLYRGRTRNILGVSTPVGKPPSVQTSCSRSESGLRRPCTAFQLRPEEGAWDRSSQSTVHEGEPRRRHRLHPRPDLRTGISDSAAVAASTAEPLEPSQGTLVLNLEERRQEANQRRSRPRERCAGRASGVASPAPFVARVGPAAGPG